MRLVSIASGSSGNAIYVGTDHTHLLVDAGVSNRRIEQGLNALGIAADELSALVITHEHTDHVRGLSVFLRRHQLPLYATGGTLRALRKSGALSGAEPSLIHEIGAERPFEVGELRLLPFAVDHDAAEPVAYRIMSGDKAAAVATDMGRYTERTVEHLLNLDAILLESNHDVRMLEAGPYPYPLKRRILGDLGHLSNESAGKLLGRILHGGMKHILLGHLSRENNLPELAYETVRCELGTGGLCCRAEELPIAVAGRDALSAVCEF